jgi:hypothetical protein
MARLALDSWKSVLASHTVPTPDPSTVALLDRYVETHS